MSDGRAAEVERPSSLLVAAPTLLRRGAAIAVLTAIAGKVSGEPLLVAAGAGAVLSLTVGALALAKTFVGAHIGGKPLRQRVLVVGSGWAGTTIVELLLRTPDAGGMDIIGFVDDEERDRTQVLGSAGTPLRFRGEPLTVLGGTDELGKLIEQHRITLLILATDGLEAEQLQTLMQCLELGVRIEPMPVLYERLTGMVPVAHVGNHWSVALPLHHPGTRHGWSITKRGTDLLLGGFGLVVLTLMLPFVAAAIRLTSKGPVFYRQTRVGKGGRTFTLYKFRSMVDGAEKDGPAWASARDPRVTTVGRILRSTHIDEFPQFLNIVRGEMSVVGPRPERPEFVETLVHEIPFYRVRTAVKPGMAGWGLVRQGYGASKDDALVKLQFDLYYIKHQSLAFDITILLKTIFDTITFRGR